MSNELTRKLQEERFDISGMSTAMVVGVFPSGKSKDGCNEQLDELTALAETYGFKVVKRLLCPIKKLHGGTYLGIGKIEEIKVMAEEEGIDVIIIDEEITPHQQKNLEIGTARPCLDRAGLIIEVFAARAQSKEARLQIELAKVRYQLPRLRRMWTHLSRQKMGGGGAGAGGGAGGGSGGAVRGSGETQIETDRRLLKSRVSFLQQDIKKVQEQRGLQRQSRLRSGVPTFAIVGYTNVGKSTLLNAFTQAGVLAEDKLFATLDTTARKFSLPNHQSVLLVDTVGLIRKLPHTLIAAFRSTLEEALYTDILLHLIDVSHPQALAQAKTTMELLEELDIKNKPIITVLNKVDQCPSEEILMQFRLLYPKTVAISAKEHTGFTQLMDLMINELKALRQVTRLRIPQSEYALVSELQKEGRVISCEYEENNILLEVEIPSRLEYKVRSFYDQNPPQ